MALIIVFTPVFLQSVLKVQLFSDFVFLLLYLLVSSILAPIVLSKYLSTKSGEASWSTVFTSVVVNIVFSVGYIYFLLSSLTIGF